MSKFWSELTASLTPYVPGEQPKDQKYIKLNTNENPYPPSPSVVEALKGVSHADLRLYPDPTCESLIHAIADRYDLQADQIFVGNGSDEILAFAFAAFFSPNRAIRFADITYSFYQVYAQLYQVPVERVPLDEAFNTPLERFYYSEGGVVIANPNAPTSKYIPVDELRAVLEHNPDQVVIIDEAYIDFGGESAVKLISSYPNLLVVQTMSKSRSLAGLRIGYAMGNQELIEGLNRIKNSFNSYTLDRLALAGGVASLQDEAYFETTNARVIQTREWTTAQLRTLGFDVMDSKANFVFITHPNQDASQLFQALRHRGVLVRFFNQPRIDQFLRVSIGTDEEMQAFIQALKEIVG
ncbi:histidinol-phosphate transaminase [Paenibacillus selenitireducens]|uniref:Histidinol-phosphate aminotransferase n=1 Tax=Paenibacillus selenitireducens TaxID=1324314 RepID=A0A1T2XCZ8_9BACL|nr:histidinol-phosphate transaminase [Paenibacillus selenitireducens]OPA77698.1 histidinol-phosphate transaminase [Paenibacillus selenitireducens]